MTPKKQTVDSNPEVTSLLKKLLILRLFELRLPQADIAKRLKLDIRVVNDFLKGIKRANGALRQG